MPCSSYFRFNVTTKQLAFTVKVRNSSINNSLSLRSHLYNIYAFVFCAHTLPIHFNGLLYPQETWGKKSPTLFLKHKAQNSMVLRHHVVLRRMKLCADANSVGLPLRIIRTFTHLLRRRTFLCGLGTRTIMHMFLTHTYVKL